MNDSKRKLREAKEKIVTQREFRRHREADIKFMMRMIEIMAAGHGFRVKNRIEFEDIQTGETFR